jgi:hypothetical protein
LLIPILFLIYQSSSNDGQKSDILKQELPGDKEGKLVSPLLTEKYKDEFVIFFSGNMAEPETQKLFFDQHKDIRYLAKGNFPGVIVVKIERDVQETLNYLKGKDYIDLIIKNQDGLECHTN